MQLISKEYNEYYIQDNGRIIMNDFSRRFVLTVDENKHTVIFKSSTISADKTYKVLAFIREEFGSEYTINCL